MHDNMEQQFWKHRSVCVTGSTGLLGSWLTDALVKKGAQVVALVRDEIPASNFHCSGCAQNVNVVYGDLLDREALERTLGEYEVDTVFHVGAQTIVGTANRNPVSTFESNIRGTWNILEAARRTPTVKRILVASSDKAYGEHEHLPYTEEYALCGRYPYDVSKSCADLIAQSYFATYGLPIAITRCANFFGGGDLNFNRIVPGTIRAVLHHEAPIIRSDGTLLRDYLYIEDAVDAYLSLAEAMEQKNLFGHAFNFSTEAPFTAQDIVEKILKLVGSDRKPVIQNMAHHEIPRQSLSAQKARDTLGWAPRHTVDEGLKKTIAWYRDFFRAAPPA